MNEVTLDFHSRAYFSFCENNEHSLQDKKTPPKTPMWFIWLVILWNSTEESQWSQISRGAVKWEVEKEKDESTDGH